MSQILQYLILTSISLLSYCVSELVIKSVQMRPLRPKDIGLIFDVTVYNDPSKKKEYLDFRIRCDQCCLQLSGNNTLCDIAKMLGGNFGEVKPGSKKIVSLLWPTVTLYNRIGHCDVNLSAYNKTGGKVKIPHTIHFDTTINKQLISEAVKYFISNFNYTECSSPDLNPLRNCAPVDCEEKYFGQMSFFNTKTNHCEVVTDCTSTSGDMIYDYTINECIDLKKVVCQEHIERLRKGVYDNNVWEPKHSVETYANYTHSRMENYEEFPSKLNLNEPYSTSPLGGILQGFFVILAALAIYLLLSCCTFSLMVLITKWTTSTSSNQPSSSRTSQR